VTTISGESLVSSQLPDQLNSRWATHISTDASFHSESEKPAGDERRETCDLWVEQLNARECASVLKPPPVLASRKPSSTDRHSRDKSSKSHESPPQRGPKPRAVHQFEQNEKLPFFVHLGMLLLILLVLHALVARLEHEEGGLVATIAALARPALQLHSQLASFALDAALLGLFASALQHLNNCPQNTGCRVASLDGVAAISCLVSITTLLQLHGGKWVQNALGVPAGAPLLDHDAASVKDASKKGATGVGIVAMEVYFPYLFVEQSELGASTP
jgi:hypothetical protein